MSSAGFKPAQSSCMVVTLQYVQAWAGPMGPQRSGGFVDAIDAGLPVNLTNDKGASEKQDDLIDDRSICRPRGIDGLLQRKADPNRLNDLGQSNIAGAVFKLHDEVRILAEAGADPRIGKPIAIEAAHIFGREELMEVLGAKQGDIGTDVPTPSSARSDR
ncbi:hypothetical protein DFJ58DRAFT_736780 [Suillus subalutaceus]|uniref:uncharacterized protein n=1 Tax=Suillus subalutaceus TaxID=48586 RepID=UPI001B860AC4|nr:uncharacterized protein DFJ58DRAFT_736780 [Suillus subalutaceus]KAG1830967.1 hypothetical protein DFJ58DRAFT_736780 [Suillus subalutaceus]